MVQRIWLGAGGVHTSRRADPYLPPAQSAGDQLAGNEAEQHCRFRRPPSAMVPLRENLTLVPLKPSLRDPGGSGSRHKFQSKGFRIYKSKLHVYLCACSKVRRIKAEGFRPVMDNRWRRTLQDAGAAIPTGWVKERAGNRRPK